MTSLDDALDLAAKEIVVLTRAQRMGRGDLEGAARRIAIGSGIGLGNARKLVRLSVRTFGQATGSACSRQPRT